LSLPSRNLQVFLLPQAMNPLEVHPPPRSDEHLMGPFTAVTRIPLAPATQFINQPPIIVRLATTVTLRRARLAQHAAELSFRNVFRPRATTDSFHDPTPSLGAYQFGRAAARRI
jgi:hypothetical protein